MSQFTINQLSYQVSDCLHQIIFDLAQQLLRFVSLTFFNSLFGLVPTDLFLVDFLTLFIDVVMFLVVVVKIFLVLATSKCDLWVNPLLLLLLLVPCPDPAEEMPGEMRHCSWHVGRPPCLCAGEERAGKEKNSKDFHHSESCGQGPRRLITGTEQEPESGKTRGPSSDCQWRGRRLRECLSNKDSSEKLPSLQPGQEGHLSSPHATSK